MTLTPGADGLCDPYDRLPTHTRWSSVVEPVDPPAFDPVVGFPFRITRRDKVAAAGASLAQHIARRLADNGFTVLVTEDGHPIGSAALRAAFHYDVYPARFGDIPTARQLLQLFQRAFGADEPPVEPWTMPDGGLVDPLRPTIQPGGFASRREYDVDRAQHLRAVRRMFETLDVFVFTLGMTECWIDRRSGAALPLCPGAAGGRYDAATTRFVNFGAAEVVDDLAAVLRGLQAVNPAARTILTVSPVPLSATALDRHVAVSASYSQAVLRVACEEIVQRFAQVAYFPAYEVITSIPAAGRYYAADRRSVEEAGIEHVMRLFLAHATASDGPVADPLAMAGDGEPAEDDLLERMSRVVAVLCDEDLLDATLDAAALRTP